MGNNELNLVSLTAGNDPIFRCCCIYDIIDQQLSVFEHILLTPNTAECRYNAVQLIAIFHTARRWEQQDVNHTSNYLHLLYFKLAPHTSPSWVRYGVFIMITLMTIRRVITALHCIQLIWLFTRFAISWTLFWYDKSLFYPYPSM